MDFDEKMHSKVNGSHTSSSAVGTLEENGHDQECTKDQERLQEFAQSNINKEFSPVTDKETKLGLVKCKMAEMISKSTVGKGGKITELKKSHNLVSFNSQALSKQQQRKVDNHVRSILSSESPLDSRCRKTWTCKNSACKAVLGLDEAFCKRCSCCICHQFDDNKDPSLWLVCISDKGDHDWCGSSCHIECAFQRQKVGVVNLAETMHLDGSYCCAACGRVSGIIGCWKKQLAVAKEARRVDILCYRINLCYRLLDGTSHFREFHDIIKDIKAKLETEVGPLNGVSAKMARGIVSRLSIAGDVHKLCLLAIEKADNWLASDSNSDPKHKDSLPPACRFHFTEITSSTLVVHLKDTSSLASNCIKGYKLWYCKSSEEIYDKEPVEFPRSQRSISISNLQPCTEYTFRIISFGSDGDLGHSEAKCFTESVEIIKKNNEHVGGEGGSSTAKRTVKVPNGESGFKVRNLGKVLRQAWAQEESCYDGFYDDDVGENSCGGSRATMRKSAERGHAEPPLSPCLDLNVASVPDLNIDVAALSDSSHDVDKFSYDRNGPEIPNGSDSRTPERGKQEMRPLDEICGVDSRLGNCWSFSSSRSSQLDNNYEYCVSIIRCLECSGHINKDFRMKFLTWFSLRASEQERRVVYAFIRTLKDEPSSLAGQLMDSFTEIVSCKRPRNGFCSKLWHL